MDAIVYLCNKSSQIRQKKIAKIQKEEEAHEDKDCEKGIIYDEDEDADAEIILGEESDELDEDDEEWDLEDDEESDNDLYDNMLDKIDEIIFVKEHLENLNQKN